MTGISDTTLWKRQQEQWTKALRVRVDNTNSRHTWCRSVTRCHRRKLQYDSEGYSLPNHNPNSCSSHSWRQERKKKKYDANKKESGRKNMTNKNCKYLLEETLIVSNRLFCRFLHYQKSNKMRNMNNITQNKK